VGLEGREAEKMVIFVIKEMTGPWPIRRSRERLIRIWLCRGEKQGGFWHTRENVITQQQQQLLVFEF